MRQGHLLIVLLPLIIPSAAGLGDQADFHDLRVHVSPSIQGVGGMVEIKAEADFYGGCCYHLYAEDVVGNISLPEGLELISGPSPARYDLVDAEPGGSPTVKTFVWKVQCLRHGRHRVNVTVSTSDCGFRNANATVIVTEGAAISIPNLFPDPPDRSRGTCVRIETSVSLPEVEIEDVFLFYALDAPGHCRARNGTLFTQDGREFLSHRVSMSPSAHDESIFMGFIPRSNAKRLSVWIVVRDSAGRNTTSPVYEYDIWDRDSMYLQRLIIEWAIQISAVAGVIAVLACCERQIRKVRTRWAIKQVDPIQRTNAYALVVLVIGIILLAAVFLTDAIPRVLERLGGPT